MGSAGEAGVADQRPVSDYPRPPECDVVQFLVSVAMLDFAAVRRWVDAIGIHPDATVGGKPTAICYAAMKGAPRLMSYLLGNGASVDTRDGTGMTPLHYAVMGGNPVCVSLLVAHGASLNAETTSGRTPLCIARTREDAADCRELLMRYGAGFAGDRPGPRRFH